MPASAPNVKGSRLEMYLAIIQTVSVSRHPLKPAEIEKATDLEQIELEEALSFLVEQRVIGKQQYGSSYAFSVAPLGAKLIRYFSSHPSIDL